MREIKSPFAMRFDERFHTEKDCLRFLFQLQYGDLKECPGCHQQRRYHTVEGRRCLQCNGCSYQLYPCKDTIFEGSKIKLLTWFKVIRDFVTAKHGLSSSYVTRTYKVKHRAALRMTHTLRRSLAGCFLEDNLRGTVYLDECFLGGHKTMEQGGISAKFIIFGMIEYGRTSCRLFYVKKKDAATLRPLINRYIQKGSTIHRDGNSTYGNLERQGYQEYLVPAKTNARFKGDRGVHNNRIEAVWSRFQRFTLNGLHVHMHPDYLQNYLDEFCVRQRGSGEWFEKNQARIACSIMLGMALSPNLSIIRKF